MSDNVLMEVKDLVFGYEKNKNIINNVSLKVNYGDRIGLVGPNGTGKTTFFRLISGIKKPMQGSIRLYDSILVPGDFRPEMGMVFQNSDDQLFCPSVWDDISFGPMNMGLSEEEITARVDKALKVVGIEKLKDRPPHHLSGGEKRLVTIAGIIAMNSKIVIYDEPTSNLDMRYRRRVINFLKEFNQDAMIIASHDLEFVLEVCNRVVVLDEGQIMADGIPENILGNEHLMAEHGLEVPHSLGYICKAVASK